MGGTRSARSAGRRCVGCFMRRSGRRPKRGWQRVASWIRTGPASWVTSARGRVNLSKQRLRGNELVDVSARRALSVCSGVGMLDTGVRVALPGARTICCVEHEAYAVHVLASRMEEGALDPCPIWSDLHTFDGRAWRGAVDFIVGGYPCQPFSQAGKRLGAEDPRHLWPRIKELIREIQPGWCFFENVRGHLTLGFDLVHRELQELGYTVEAGLFSAEEVGASHRRERLFILAVANDRNRLLQVQGRGSQGRNGAGSAGEVVADTKHGTGRKAAGLESGEQSAVPGGGREAVGNAADNHGRRGVGGAEEGARSGGLGRRGPAGSGGEVADAPIARRDDARKYDGGSPLQAARSFERGGGLADSSVEGLPDAELEGVGGSQILDDHEGQGPTAAEFRGTLPFFAPGPSDLRIWGRVVTHGSLDGLAPATQPGVRLLADGLALVVDESRPQQLRACGNGVVPLQAAFALVVLARKIREVLGFGIEGL